MQRGVAYALASAVLFGLSTPLAKALVGSISPLLLAGLLYAGSGCGLLLVLLGRALWTGQSGNPGLPPRAEWLWLAGSMVFGGVAAPVALLYGLAATTASTASLLLNLEAVFTALLAWFLFRENVDRRIALGMLAIVAGGLTLAWTPGELGRSATGPLLIGAACLCWAIDNNLTRKISASDAVAIAALKGLAAGGTNIGLALLIDSALPATDLLGMAAALGFVGYGVSLVLFVIALRHLGTARTGAYFSIAPFFGAAFAVVLYGDSVTWQLVAAGTLMGIGVWLHLTEHHSHLHGHELLEHAHAHAHDDHHRHSHDFPWDGREPHVHAHRHEPLVHAHHHFPDVHHRHPH
jgi:drug/metabolite transporter (DMT)-like permease